MRRIIIDPDGCNGPSMIEGTRIAARTEPGFPSAGDAIGDFLDEYAALPGGDVHACVDHSARLMKDHFFVQAVA